METLDLNGNPVSTVGEYEYDGDGKRVKKHVPSTGEVTVFVYDAGGKLIGEYSTVAAPQSPKVSYTTADHLGSPRILTDENGTTISRRDFMPYGEEIMTPERHPNLSYTADDLRQNFTTYERDGETQLDFAQARMHSFDLGRFSSPDPYNIIFEKENGKDDREKVALLVGFVSSPQRWNAYIYVLNNPLALTDPDGLTPKTINIFLDLVNEEGRKQWDEFKAAAEKKGFTVNIYQKGTKEFSASNFLKSLKAKDTATIFSGHSHSADLEGKDRVGISFGSTQIGNQQSKRTAKASHTADGVDIQNDIVAVFSCGFGSGFDNVNSSNGASFVSIVQGSSDVQSGMDSVNSAARAFAESLVREYSGVLGSGPSEVIGTRHTKVAVSVNAAQIGFARFQHPTNLGDKVGYRTLRPAKRGR